MLTDLAPEMLEIAARRAGAQGIANIETQVCSADDLPFGLATTGDVVYWATIGLGLLVLFAALCITYAAVPKGAIPWTCVWPGALVWE